MFELFSGKGKKGKFEIEITIHGLSGVPYLSGFYFAKWKTKGLRCISGSTTRYISFPFSTENTSLRELTK